MKRKLMLGSLLLVTKLLMGQNYLLIDSTRYLCTYTYNFQEDSTSLYSLKTQNMTLQIGSHFSKFCSENMLRTDSLLYENRNMDLQSAANNVLTFAVGNSTNLLCRYEVFKGYPQKGDICLTSYQNKQDLRVIRPIELDWQIEMNRDTVMLGYNCKMAHVRFAGRNYNAWFSPEIPISDGPYKFRGLPGLILEITDTKKQHCFSLSKIKKVEYPKPLIYADEKYVDVTAEDFVKALNANLARLLVSVQSGSFTFKDEADKAKSIHKLKSRNNFIEKY